jgi:putative sigma-54 modulation protein
MTQHSDNLSSKIIMQGVHVQLTAAMQNSIREKFAVLLRHNERIDRIHVKLNEDQHHGNTYHYVATARIEIAGPDLIASVKGADAYNVIDGLVAKLDEQLRERHERRKDKRNHPHSVDLDVDLPKAAND